MVINSMIDNVITNQLKAFLSMGKLAGKNYSDVIVKEGNVEIDQLYGKPEKLNDMLRERHIPAKVIVLHIKNAKVKIPWFSWATGYVEVMIEEVVLVLQPVDPDDLTVEHVRWAKESLILKAMNEFVSQQHQARKAAAPSMLSRLKAQAMEAFRPKVTVENVHLRYEQLIRSKSHEHPFAFGILLPSFSMQLDTQGTDSSDVSVSRVKVLLF